MRKCIHKNCLHYLKCDWISISLRSWCSRWLFWSCDLNNTLSATTNLDFFSLARYTFPNLPLPKGRPISKFSKVHLNVSMLNQIPVRSNKLCTETKTSKYLGFVRSLSFLTSVFARETAMLVIGLVTFCNSLNGCLVSILKLSSCLAKSLCKKFG